MKTNHDNREAWLIAAVAACAPLFIRAGYKVPEMRVACGWPATGGLAKKQRRIGECWSPKASTDKLSQIFISPFLTEVDGECGVLSTLIHEMVHAVVGIDEGHNKVFGKCARLVGLEGKLTATVAGDALVKEMGCLAKKLGPYPHARLDALRRPTKKQTTRLLKCECEKCGYIARVTKKWLVDAGAPGCPIRGHGALHHEAVEELEEEER